MPRPISASFDLEALRRNYALAKRLAPGARAWAVVKANAYGHGLDRVARTLVDADGFALLDLDEAIRLRELGRRQPILLLEGFFESQDLQVLAANDLWTVIHSDEQIDMLAAAVLPRSLNCFLKMNSGMNRLGFVPARFGAAYSRLAALPNVASVTPMTHFADADGTAGVAAQLAQFEAASAGLASSRSIANSAALLRFAVTRTGWVRPGIMLYGCSPFADENAAALGLSPVMTLSSRVIAVQALAAGDAVGYGGTFTARTPMRIGIVACGYADGYPRHAPTGTPILVDDVRTRTIGRVSMDMIAVDLTPLQNAGVGSSVTLWGRGLSADEVAASAGTVSYELLCALARRVPQIETT